MSWIARASIPQLGMKNCLPWTYMANASFYARNPLWPQQQSRGQRNTLESMNEKDIGRGPIGTSYIQNHIPVLHYALECHELACDNTTTCVGCRPTETHSLVSTCFSSPFSPRCTCIYFFSSPISYLATRERAARLFHLWLRMFPYAIWHVHSIHLCCELNYTRVTREETRASSFVGTTTPSTYHCVGLFAVHGSYTR